MRDSSPEIVKKKKKCAHQNNLSYINIFINVYIAINVLFNVMIPSYGGQGCNYVRQIWGGGACAIFIHCSLITKN